MGPAVPVPGTCRTTCPAGWRLITSGGRRWQAENCRLGNFFVFSEPDSVRSDFVVVAGDADNAGHVVVVIVLVGFEEGVVVIVVEFDVVVADIRDVVVAVIVVRVLERDELDLGVLGGRCSDLNIFGLLHDRGDGGLLEIGKRPGFAGVRRYDRILVQIIEFLPRVRAGAFGAKFCFRHCQSLLKS